MTRYKNYYITGYTGVFELNTDLKTAEPVYFSVKFAPMAQVMLCLRHSDDAPDGRSDVMCSANVRSTHNSAKPIITPAGLITFRTAEHIVEKKDLPKQFFFSVSDDLF